MPAWIFKIEESLKYPPSNRTIENIVTQTEIIQRADRKKILQTNVITNVKGQFQEINPGAYLS